MLRSSDEDWQALALDISSAFSPGAPIEEQEVFAGRIEQLRELVLTTRQRGSHAVVFGERGVGKTSLANVLRLVLHDPNRSRQCVRVNGSKEDTFHSLLMKVFKRLIYQTDEGKQRLSDDYEGKTLTPDDVQLELETFTDDQDTVIIFDEFDRIKSKKVTAEVAELIKTLSDYSVRVTVVLVGIAENVAGLVSEHKSITRALTHIHMPRMSLDELGQIIAKRYQANGIKCTDDAIWKMSFLASGLPFYAHLIGQQAALAAVLRRSDTVGADDVDSAIQVAIKKIDITIVEDYLAAVISQKGDETLYEPVLLACSLAEADELGRFQQTAVGAPLSKIRKRQYNASTYAFHLNKFCEEERKEVLQRFGEVRNYRYRFREALMQPYVILRGLESGMINDEIAQTFANRRQLELDLG